MNTKQSRPGMHLPHSEKVKLEMASTPVVESAALLQGAQQVVIHHQGEDYCLRLTKQGKLILTK